MAEKDLGSESSSSACEGVADGENAAKERIQQRGLLQHPGAGVLSICLRGCHSKGVQTINLPGCLPRAGCA